MRLRDLFVIVLILVLFSTVIGLAALLYVYVRGVPDAITGDTQAGQGTTHVTATLLPYATSTPLPPLITPTPTHTPLPTATPSPAPSPTPTPTPTFTPSPTPVPAARLGGAHQARHNGDYRAARTEFETVMQDPEAGWEAMEASYQAGIVAYLDGDHAAAQEGLGQFIAAYPDDHRVGTAHFYLAEALTQQGDYAGAIQHYHTYLGQQDVLADLVYARIGQNHSRLGQYEAAIEAYEQAVERTPDLGLEFDLREQIAQVYSAWGRYEQAIEWLRGITGRSENVHRLARIWYLMGQAYRLAGQEDRAIEAFARAVEGDPRPGYAHLALVELVDTGAEVDEYQRGMIDYHAGSYEAAVAAFNRHMDSADYDGDAHYYVALSYMNAGSYVQAVQECERALARFRPNQPDLPGTMAHWGEMWLLQGRALAQMEREGEAIATYSHFAQTYPEHSLAPEALWRAAQLLEQDDRFAQAADLYADLANAHADDERAPAARFRAGLSRYRSNDLDGALIAWKELVNRYPASVEAPRGQYWLGKALWSQGETQEARGTLQALVDEHPRDYYALRAADMLAHNGQVVPWRQAPTSIHVTSDRETDKAQAEDWLRSWANIPQADDLAKVPPEMAGDLRFRRAMEMHSIGLHTEARDAFEELRHEIDQDPLALYRLAILTRDLGLYAPSMRATIDLITLAPEDSVLDMPVLVQRLAFPVYYADLVLAECTTQEIDPLLMFALIRQESVFDAQIASWAGAVGLAQIMPSTGQWIAEMTAWPEYSEEMLQRAYLNVKFGAWFLARILDQTEGDVMAALAGYNGGPAYATQWMEQARGDPDLFVEIITRDEPQRYVRLIYRHYDVYARLYGSKGVTSTE